MPDRRAFRELMYFGGGFTVARLANFAALQGDNLIVGRWLGPAALGLYGRAYQLMSVPAVLLGEALDTVLFPAMARVQQEPQRLANAYRRGVALVALLMCPLSVVLAIAAPALLTVVLGAKWNAVILPFQVLTLGMLFRTSYKLSDSLARATGAVYRRAWRQIVYAGSILGGSWIGQHWGITGVAAGVVGALTINFLLMAHLSTRLAQLPWRGFAAAHLPALRLAAVAGGSTWVVSAAVRHWGLSPLAALIAMGSAALLSVATCVYAGPRLFLGRDGLWMLQMLRAFVPRLRSRTVTPVTR
jgi:PST family polysaccharide transporter